MPGKQHLPRATAKEQRQYEHILASEMKRGRAKPSAKRIAAATARNAHQGSPKQSQWARDIARRFFDEARRTPDFTKLDPRFAPEDIDLRVQARANVLAKARRVKGASWWINNGNERGFMDEFRKELARLKTQSNPSKVKKAARATGRALKGAARGILSTGAGLLESGAAALNPTLTYWNVYFVDSNRNQKWFVTSSPFGVSKADALARVRRSHYPGKLKAGQKLIAEKAVIEDTRKPNSRKRKNKTIIKARKVTVVAPNPRKRLKVRNKYIDLVIKGTAKKTPQGWRIGGKNYAQGKGTVKLASGYYLDKATGYVYAKRERNISEGFYDSGGVFHPIRASADYDPSIAGEGGGRARTTRSKKSRASKSKASKTARHRAAVKSVKSTRSRLAGRSLARATSTGKRLRQRNIEQGFYDEHGFHPIRASADYSEGQRPSRSRRAKAIKRKAASTHGTRSRVKSRKATASRLAGRSLKKSAGMLKRRKNAYEPPRVSALKVRAVAKHAYAIWKRKGRHGEWLEYLDQNLSKEGGISSQWNRAYAMVQDMIERGSSYGSKATRKARKRNPSPDAIRKDFAGRVGKGAELYFPEGTPTGLAKLGKLVSIQTEEGTLKPTNGTAWLCADTKGKLHIGTTANKPLWSGDAHSFGSVRQVEYLEAKPHLGFPNPIVFYHKLGEENGVKPKLYADGKGGLKFRGGAYRITREGIVN